MHRYTRNRPETQENSNFSGSKTPQTGDCRQNVERQPIEIRDSITTCWRHLAENLQHADTRHLTATGKVGYHLLERSGVITIIQQHDESRLLVGLVRGFAQVKHSP